MIVLSVNYATPEQKVGVIEMDRLWESCITIGEQWSWKPNDKMKSIKKCIDILVQTAGGNGNLLLNISPMANGEIEHRVIMRLKEIGAWIKKYWDAIYNTNGNPFRPSEIFTSTRKGTQINILLLRQVTHLTLPVIPGCNVLDARIMGGKKVRFSQDANGIHLELSGNLPDVNCNVVSLKIDKPALNIPLINQ